MNSPSFDAGLTGHNLTAITPTDGVFFADHGVLFIGTGGHVAVIAGGDDAASPVVLKNVPSGTLLPITVRCVRFTGTTAADIVLVR